MLTLYGGASRFCDGVSRRNFLKIGALGLGGLALPQLLRAEALSGKRSQKAVIMVFLPGGPPHQDLFDLKPDAPSEVRGEFRPIPTNVPGIQICEHLPLLAKMMDKLTIIRSICNAVDDHSDFACLTGRPKKSQPPGGWPALGSIVSRLQGPLDPAMPPFVGLEPNMDHRPYNESGPGFLGVSHRSFRPQGEGKSDMTLNGITRERLADRRSLLRDLDRFKREVDSGGMMQGVDEFNEQALGVLTSSKVLDALDITRESAGVAERYGKGNPTPRVDAAGRMTEHFLIARRLVEAGARVVTVAFGFWDYHNDLFRMASEDLPMLDRGLSALIQDLHDRGLDKDVSVIVWGEFGRSPIINKERGREHWPRVSCALLAGGGMRTGQVIGATDRLGGEVTDRPVEFGEVFATLYHNLGINPNATTVTDLSGRPHYLVDGQHSLRELI